MRLYPSVPRNGRFANKNTTLPRGGGPDGMSPILIKQGQAVMYSIYSTHVILSIMEKMLMFSVLKDGLNQKLENWDGHSCHSMVAQEYV